MRAVARYLVFCAAVCASAPAFAGSTLEASLGKMGSGHPGEERDAAYAACILYGRDQSRLIGVFDAAGWERHAYDEEGTWSYSPAGQSQTLWVMLYANDTSCSVVDQQTGTPVAAARLQEMLAGGDFAVTPVTPVPEGECPQSMIASPALGGSVRLQVISGGDYADCTSDSASAVIVDQGE